MKTTLCFAAVAASLAIAPVAIAQTYYENDASKAPPSASSTSSGRTDSPSVKSLPGVDPEPWRAAPPTRVNRNADHRAMNQEPPQDHLYQTQAPRAASGSTGGAATNYDATGASNRSATQGQTVSNADIKARRGRGQRDLELRQTTLLNQFSAAGYTMVRDFRKEGDRYTAQAQDQNGRWASVELDPHTGTITPR